MQQHYSPNLENDPIRNSLKTTELLPRKNVFSMMKNKVHSEQPSTFNNSASKQPDLYNNIFTENYNRNDGLNEEMIEKDKKIQELEFKLQQTEFEKESFKNKFGIIKKYEEETKTLSLKLRQEYEKNKELVILKNKLSIFEQSKKVDDKIISELRKKLKMSDEYENEEGITLDLMRNVDNGSDEDEGIKDIDYEDIYKKTLEAENKRNINLDKYNNDKLKSIIKKYINTGNDSIDDVFIKMKIDENVTITKDLISRIISELKQ